MRAMFFLFEHIFAVKGPSAVSWACCGIFDSVWRSLYSLHIWYEYCMLWKSILKQKIKNVLSFVFAFSGSYRFRMTITLVYITRLHLPGHFNNEKQIWVTGTTVTSKGQNYYRSASVLLRVKYWKTGSFYLTVIYTNIVKPRSFGVKFS